MTDYVWETVHWGILINMPYLKGQRKKHRYYTSQEMNQDMKDERNLNRHQWHTYRLQLAVIDQTWMQAGKQHQIVTKNSVISNFIS